MSPGAPSANEAQPIRLGKGGLCPLLDMRREHGRWHGPAELIALERNKVVWLSHLGRLVRASPEQLRPASFRKWAKLPKDEKGHPAEQHQTRQQRLWNIPNFLDVEREERPERVTEEDIDMEGTEPEREVTPESSTLVPGLPPNPGMPEAPQENSSAEFSLDNPPPLTLEELAAQEQSQNAPVPGSSEDELEFGDVEVDEALVYAVEIRCGR